MVYGVGKQGVQSTQGGFEADLHGVAELIGVVEGVTGVSDPKQCGVVLIVFGSGAGDGGGADRSECRSNSAGSRRFRSVLQMW